MKVTNYKKIYGQAKSQFIWLWQFNFKMASDKSKTFSQRLSYIDTLTSLSLMSSFFFENSDGLHKAVRLAIQNL